MSRTCPKCSKTEPEVSFRAGRRVCVMCIRADQTARRTANIERERAKDRERCAKRIIPRGRSTTYRLKNPEKRAAHNAVLHALRHGTLTRQPCEKCGNPKVDAHHDSYQKPLEVRWLCRVHHKEYHRLNRVPVG